MAKNLVVPVALLLISASMFYTYSSEKESEHQNKASNYIQKDDEVSSTDNPSGSGYLSDSIHPSGSGFSDSSYPSGSGFSGSSYPSGSGFSGSSYPSGSGFSDSSYPSGSGHSSGSGY